MTRCEETFSGTSAPPFATWKSSARRRRTTRPSRDFLWRQARQRRDSIEAYSKGGRDDLVSKEEDELAIIMEYLPAELTDEEISEIASKAVDEVGATSPREMGKVMGRIIPQVEGRADLKKVSQTVAALLRERS